RAPLPFAPLAFERLRLLLDFRGGVANRDRPPRALAETTHHVVAARVDDDLRPVPVLLFSEDALRRDAAVVGEPFEFREPAVDKLPERSVHLDVPPRNVETHGGQLEQDLSLVGRGDLQLLAVLRDGSP